MYRQSLSSIGDLDAKGRKKSNTSTSPQNFFPKDFQQNTLQVMQAVDRDKLNDKKLNPIPRKSEDLAKLDTKSLGIKSTNSVPKDSNSATLPVNRTSAERKSSVRVGQK